MSDPTDDDRVAAFDAALRESLDVLEEVVRTTWLFTGGGHYRQPSASFAETLANVLATRRPDRWERTANGLQWHLVGAT